MMRGVNVAAAVAVPVVLLLLLLVIGVVGVVGYYKCCQINKGLLSMPWCTYAKASIWQSVHMHCTSIILCNIYLVNMKFVLMCVVCAELVLV